MLFLALAFAMDYLHNGYSTSVVHYDLKPSNVLLDQEMVGHVSDFGIVKLLGAGETFVQTMTIATIGYTAPEYGQNEIVSMSCDVDSFGILMMETHGSSRFLTSYRQKLIGKPWTNPSKIATKMNGAVVDRDDGGGWDYEGQGDDGGAIMSLFGIAVTKLFI
ncbi:hypothetical protein BC332_25607 [Capsicum chinense]|nr:hypothetical protein BC332_25607 [Capsicum chinense]